MPFSLRTVFVLSEIEELEAAKIAELLDIPVGTVASRLRRAREDFRARVDRLQRPRAVDDLRARCALVLSLAACLVLVSPACSERMELGTIDPDGGRAPVGFEGNPDDAAEAGTSPAADPDGSAGLCPSNTCPAGRTTCPHHPFPCAGVERPKQLRGLRKDLRSGTALQLGEVPLHCGRGELLRLLRARRG